MTDPIMTHPITIEATALMAVISFWGFWGVLAWITRSWILDYRWTTAYPWSVPLTISVATITAASMLYAWICIGVLVFERQ
jgi:hypothetical protein